MDYSSARLADWFPLLRRKPVPRLSRDDAVEELIYENPLALDLSESERVYSALVDRALTARGTGFPGRTQYRMVVIEVCLEFDCSVPQGRRLDRLAGKLASLT